MKRKKTQRGEYDNSQMACSGWAEKVGLVWTGKVGLVKGRERSDERVIKR